jgi:F0F1-type ATP synthase assembly protein I
LVHWGMRRILFPSNTGLVFRLVAKKEPMRYLLSVYVALVMGALVGAVVGFGLEQAVGQAGWALVLGSLGANAGAFWAAMRRADQKAVWRSRS